MYSKVVIVMVYATFNDSGTNKLTGTIPTELGNIHSLERLDIGKLLSQTYDMN